MIAIIDFTKFSREYALKGKEILLFKNNELVGRKMYSETDVRNLMRDDWFVWDRTAGREISGDIRFEEGNHLILGRLNLPSLEGLI